MSRSDPDDRGGEEGILGGLTTLFELVERRARHHGDARALTFLRDGENEESHLTYADLDRQARSLAGWLQENGLVGERVLLLFPPGLDFIIAFLGCLYAGAIAVPAYPPRQNRNLIRLSSIVADAQASVALTTKSVQDRTQRMLTEAGLTSLRVISTDELQHETADRWQRPAADKNTLAFLQYTSGSTSHPKGVMVSHGNLLENHRMMKYSFGQSHQSRIVTWLPLFHDMGLIGNVLQAVYLGTDCVILPPEVFLMKPVRWLSAISRYRARFSGAPNFAYELCARKVTDEQRGTLDLSCWESAFVGAEPVRHETLERFAAAFAPCGFRKEALYPCYGLAEATLFVSGAGKSAGASTAWFDGSALEKHQVVKTPDRRPDARPLVSCGHGWLEQRIVIADPDTGRRRGPDKVGEIWVSGPNIAQGYWNRPDETESAFGARPSGDSDGRFLRTGDLGFFHEEALFIAGRLKDLIIIAGRNHDPVDIEHTVQSSHPGIRPGGCAAFQVEVRGEARLVIAAELERTWGASAGGRSERDRDPGETKTVLQAVREAVALHHDLATLAIVFLKPAGLPKTSSGKIQRHACRAAYLAGTLNEWSPHP